MANNLVALLGVARIKGKCNLGCFCARIPAKQQAGYTQQFEKGIERVRPVGSARSKMDINGGVLFIQVDTSAEYVYGAIVTEKTYPDRIAFQMLTEFQNALLMAVGPAKLGIASAKSLERPFKKQARDIIVKYADASSLDPTAQVINKVESVKVIVDQNIKKVLQNQGNLEDLATRTDNLATTAKQFKKDANEIRKFTWRQKMGLTIVLGVLLAGIIAYIVYALVELFI